MTKIHLNKMLPLRKNLLVIVMVLLFPFYITGLVSLGTLLVHAGSGPPLPPPIEIPGGGGSGVFGGQIGGTIQCTCTGGHVMTVGPPRPGTFYLAPGYSQVFEYGQTKRPGAWVLGTYTPASPCLKRVGRFCVPIPHQGNIQLIGTSL